MVNLPVVTLFIVFGLSCLVSKAENRLTGRVFDGDTNEALEGVVIGYNNYTVAITDEEGLFTLQIPDNENDSLVFSHLGYQTKTVLFSYMAAVGDTVHIDLAPLSVEMDEVLVVHSNHKRFIDDTRTGVIELSLGDSQYLPQFIGQSDLFKTLELMPGFQTGGEGDAAIYIRGGSFDQNLILLNGAPVYNPSHLLGFYSVFNPDIIDNIELIKSGIPVEYGNRLSSVINCSVDNRVIGDSIAGKGSAGVLSTAFSSTIPIVKDELTLYAGFRRTHINIILDLMDKFDLMDTRSVDFETGYDFYDINAGLNYQPNDRHTFSLDFYKGRDLFDMFTPDILLDADMSWGNELVTFNWNHKINRNFSASHNLYYSSYDYELDLRNPAYNLNLGSSVSSVGHKSKLSYFADRFKIEAGVDNKYQKFTPNSSDVSTSTIKFDFGSVDSHNLGEYSLFLSMDGELSTRWMLSAGVRLNRAVHYGSYRHFHYDDNNVISDTTFYSSGEAIYSFTNPDYMASLRYRTSGNSSLKFSFNRNHQYTHMVNATAVSFPVDFWVSSGKDIPSQSGWQVATGWYKLSNNNDFRFSVEGYYKETKNHSEFDNAFMRSVDNTSVVESLVYGKGKSWGIEFLAHKMQGRWKGWLGYTFSKSISSIEEIEQGRWFPTSYDRPHDISLVTIYDHNEKWKFGGTFVYSTGRPFTPSIGRYFLENNVVSIYGAHNSDRFPDFHRFDLSATRVLKDSNNRYSALTLSIYNVYNRSNPFFIFPKTTGDLNDYYMEVEPYEVSIFPILPSVSWQFRF
ncbi:TonB-dependent receptor plug domain-containing protein [Marinilabiliaceae bacterium ANBcel2]|nr:TonB-dependent receptor plug domain-containing protein [Marinilabiliaceae bacterium ANBcel2]